MNNNIVMRNWKQIVKSYMGKSFDGTTGHCKLVQEGEKFYMTFRLGESKKYTHKTRKYDNPRCAVEAGIEKMHYLKAKNQKPTIQTLF